MKLKSLAVAAAITAAAASSLLTAPAFAQAKEQFFPVLVYRTGAYAPNGVPFANRNRPEVTASGCAKLCWPNTPNTPTT